MPAFYNLSEQQQRVLAERVVVARGKCCNDHDVQAALTALRTDTAFAHRVMQKHWKVDENGKSTGSND